MTFTFLAIGLLLALAVISTGYTVAWYIKRKKGNDEDDWDSNRSYQKKEGK